MTGVKQAGRIAELIEKAAYGELKSFLDGLECGRLAAAWPELKPLERLVAFKLLDGPAAMQFYGELSFKEKYFMLCGFPLNAIAPVLENLGLHERRLFRQLPRDCYDRMFRQLVSERSRLDIPAGRQ